MLLLVGGEREPFAATRRCVEENELTPSLARSYELFLNESIALFLMCRFSFLLVACKKAQESNPLRRLPSP